MELTPDLNPLNSLKQNTVYHILVAFEYAEDAYTSTITSKVGEQGDILNASELGGRCGGKAIVVINEFASQQTRVGSVETNWSFFSPMNPFTTSYVGSMEVTDRSGFLFTESLAKLIYDDAEISSVNFRFYENTPDLDVSLHHLTFAWVPVFSGTRGDTGVKEQIYINPLYFNITRFTQGVTALSGRTYILDFVSCYNTFGQGPQFSKIAQSTITKPTSGTLNSLPSEATESERMRPIRQQDAAKARKRRERLERTSYMRTIGEACGGMEASLNAQTSSHKSQVQKFLEIITDGYRTGVVQSKVDSKLPITYKINVDDYYKSMELDNRNLPFEQYEQNQNMPGVSSITFPANYDISTSLLHIMRMSKDVGRDYGKVPATAFKITTTTNRTCEKKYLVNVKINPYTSPYNSKNGINTGPGQSAIDPDKVIQYTYQDVGSEDITVNAISYSAAPMISLSPADAVESRQGYAAVYGNREPPSNNRTNSVVNNFFENAFSGLKGAKGLLYDSGLENSEVASNITNFNPFQHIRYAVTVTGNPFLLNDLNRNPLDVIEPASNIGRYEIYKNVEFEPFYIKLKVFLAGDTRSQIADDATFYYEDYLHVTDVRTVITSGTFTQTIYCNRTEEKL